MDWKLRFIYETIDALGVSVEVCELPDDRDGEYVHDARLIRLQSGLLTRPFRSTLAHECAHAVFGDLPSPFGPVMAKQEHRAQAWAAWRLITIDEYRDAESVHDGNVEAMAVETDVTVDLVEAFRDLLERVGQTTYVAPRMGAGQYAARVDIAW